MAELVELRSCGDLLVRGSEKLGVCLAKYPFSRLEFLPQLLVFSLDQDEVVCRAPFGFEGQLAEGIARLHLEQLLHPAERLAERVDIRFFLENEWQWIVGLFILASQSQN